MDHAGLETLVKLTPIGAPHEFERVFSLDLNKKEIEIGRASRNATKGLTAADHNAWFDSPIMSRQHAKFSLPSVWGNGIYLQDYGSTHGTFLRSIRLKPLENYTVNNGEVITFGVKITSGPVSYPAREFRVQLSWQPCSLSSQLTFSSPFARGGFRIPEDEVESVADKSREVSLKIIDAHPRTYSVPSSDDDTDSEEDEEMNDASSVTTPEQLAKKQQIYSDCESDSNSDHAFYAPTVCQAHCAKDLDHVFQRQETLGTSQSNPIDLEVPPKHKDNSFDIESDDEGPEILPISQPYLHASGKATSTESFGDPKPGSQSARTPMDSFSPIENHQDSPTINSSSNPSGQDVVGTQNTRSRVQTPVSYLQGPIEDTEDDFDSVDEDDDYDDEDELFMEQNNCTERLPPGGTYQQHSGLLRFPAPKSRDAFNLGESVPPKKTAHDPMISCAGGLDVTQDTMKNYLSVAQRPPSPSDAALAKKADSIGSKYRCFSNDEFSTNSSSAYLNNFGKQQETLSSAYQIAVAQIPPHASNSEFSTQHMFESLEAETSRYEDGPFASPTDTDRFPQYPPHLSWRPCTVPDPMQPEKYIVGSSTSSKPLADGLRLRYTTPATPKANDTTYKYPPNSGENALQKSSEPSKVNISDLVNSYADTARNLKRKVEDISTDSQPYTPVAARSQVFPLDDLKSQDIVLSDAQAQDFPVVESSISQESSVPMVIDSNLNPRVAHISSTDGSARKKVRTSKSRVGGVGKFVSGVFVGVAGALAAFLATIPLSVREEALREFQNAAQASNGQRGGR